MKDEKGEEMHKSKGNAIEFNEAAEREGADAMRWLYASHNPGIQFADSASTRFATRVANSSRSGTSTSSLTYARIDKFNPSLPPLPYERSAGIGPLDIEPVTETYRERAPELFQLQHTPVHAGSGAIHRRDVALVFAPQPSPVLEERR